MPLLNPGNFATYNWFDNSTAPTFIVDTTNIPAGNYSISVEVTDVNGCSDRDTVEMVLTICTGLEEAAVDGIKIIPNPTNGIVNLYLDGFSGSVLIELVDLQGQVVLIKQIGMSTRGQLTELDLSSFAKGLYYLRAGDGNRNSVKKIVLQ